MKKLTIGLSAIFLVLALSCIAYATEFQIVDIPSHEGYSVIPDNATAGPGNFINLTAHVYSTNESVANKLIIFYVYRSDSSGRLIYDWSGEGVTDSSGKATTFCITPRTPGMYVLEAEDESRGYYCGSEGYLNVTN